MRLAPALFALLIVSPVLANQAPEPNQPPATASQPSTQPTTKPAPRRGAAVGALITVATLGAGLALSRRGRR